MNSFFNIYKLSLDRLLKNWYTIFFLSLTIFPVLTAIFLRFNPQLLTTPNPNHPANQVQEKTLDPSNQANNSNTSAMENPIASDPNTNDSNSNQTKELSEEEKLKQEEIRKSQDVFFGPQYFQRSWSEVFLGLTYYFLVGSISLLAMASLGSRMISNEVESGTLQLLFLRPIGRCTIYLAKYAGLVTIGIFLTAPAMMLIYIITYWGNFSILAFLYDFMILLLAVMAYSAVYLFMSIFKEGLYIALAYTIFWEIFVGFITERARAFAVSYYVRSLYYTLFFDPTKFPEYDVVLTWQAVCTLLGISIILITIGIGLFRKQEFNFC